ncbi:VanW family protein [Oceanobacillus chungangensis]|uniref:Peptidoglycan binding domain-containing protein n=1 Tax=Oceanobacillus chungangensis TaxID=1229152 RepID=A0A3D8PQM4_9BACI|nr:VanW family protein [Oceanobacillus chungangensis]RDW18002.1 hypothetical protein CWR45_11785 [Oceanobacillus chungangensis]
MIISSLSILLFMFLAHTTEDTMGVSSEDIMLQNIEVDQYSLPYFEPIFLDEGKVQLLMDRLEETIYKEPVNARFSANGQIMPEILGETLDRNQFQILFREHFYSNRNSNFEVPKKPIYPKVDRGLLKEISTKQLGTYTTFFRKNNAERAHNIALATEAINNYVLFPGETFSFNEIVGERTRERGYKRAPVIVRGELSEDIGGGICQVSSTLYNAVDINGIQIVERYAHSRNVPYVPKGRDATVSWWGPDFVFKNMYNAPILIRSVSVNGTMWVSIYSSDTAEYFTGK